MSTRERIDQIVKGNDFDPMKKSAIAGELTILVCLVFVGMCVNSFIQAKKARKAKEAAEAQEQAALAAAEALFEPASNEDETEVATDEGASS